MKFRVQKINGSKRLDEVILDCAKNNESQFSSINRSQIKKLINGGLIKLNDEVITKSGIKLKSGDRVQIDLPKSKMIEFDLPVIFEDENVIVYNKPSGMLTHAKGGYLAESTLSSALEYKLNLPKNLQSPGSARLVKTSFSSFNETTASLHQDKTTFSSTKSKHEESQFLRKSNKTIELGGERTGIVHRLDRDTSGVIICAKNPEAKSYLMKQFSDRKTKKTYLAVIEGEPKICTVKLDWPIGRNPKNPSFFRVSPDGKPAQTIYEVIDYRDNLSIVKLNPITGRTHQLRVHMLHLGQPIVGDRFYNRNSKVQAPRLMLHAYSLEITIPGGIRKIFKANPPEEFQSFLKNSNLSLKGSLSE